MTNELYVASYHGKFDESDKNRAIAAAETALKGIDAKSAYEAWQAEIDNDTRSELATAWENAEVEANIALTEGWHNTEGASIELAVR